MVLEELEDIIRVDSLQHLRPRWRWIFWKILVCVMMESNATFGNCGEHEDGISLETCGESEHGTSFDYLQIHILWETLGTKPFNYVKIFFLWDFKMKSLTAFDIFVPVTEDFRSHKFHNGWRCWKHDRFLIFLKFLVI